MVGVFSRGGFLATKASVAAVIAAGVGVLSLIAIGVGVMQLRDDEPPAAAIECVTGEDARNRIAPSGREAPASGVFETIEAGEAFICLDVPRLPEVEGWYVANVNAERSHSLDRFEPGEFSNADGGYRFLGINYLNPKLDGLITFDFTVYPAALLRRLGIEGAEDSTCQMIRHPILGETLEKATATVRGRDASVLIYADPAGRGTAQNLIVCWQDGDLFYSAYARYGTPLDYRSDILPFLERVKQR